MKKNIVVLLVSCLALVACSPQGSEQNSFESIEQPTPVSRGEKNSTQVSVAASVNLADVSSEKSESTGETRVVPAPRERSSEAKLIHEVSLDLSKRLGVDLSLVSLTESLPVLWENEGVGCPAEGIDYAPVKTEGYKITLEVSGVKYTYHSKGLESFLLCEGGKPMPPLK